MKAVLAFVLAIAALFAPLTQAVADENNEAAAAALVERYLHLHNAHRLEAVMVLYAEDAVFHLNMGRDAVHGREAIRELERFDVYAGSTLQPYGLTFERRGDEWIVHVAGVIEHSDIFSALGVVIVATEPVRDGFVIRDGHIAEIRQPEIRLACRQVILPAFTQLTAWLEETGDVRAPELIIDGRLNLVPGTIPLIVSALKDWRAETGWSGDPALVRACARP